MLKETILTQHPEGKSGRNINRKIYETVREAIILALQYEELTHKELFDRLNVTLKDKIPGNINWYAETVKLDLEARNTIERTLAKPQKYRLK